MDFFELIKAKVAEHSDKEINFKQIRGPGTEPQVESCFDEGKDTESPTTYQALCGAVEIPHTFEHSTKMFDALSGMGVDAEAAAAAGIAQSILSLIEPKKFMEPEEPVMGFTNVLQAIGGIPAGNAAGKRLMRLREALMALQSPMAMEAYIMSHCLTEDFAKQFKLKRISGDRKITEGYTNEIMQDYVMDIVFNILEETPDVKVEVDGPMGEKTRLMKTLGEFVPIMQRKLFEKADDGETRWDTLDFNCTGHEDGEKTRPILDELERSMRLLIEAVIEGKSRGKIQVRAANLANYCLFIYYHNQM